MSTPASIAGHPIHPILVALPIGLWVFAFVADLAGAFDPRQLWDLVAFYGLLGGLIGAVLAAIPGIIDYSHVRWHRDPRAARLVRLHLLTIVAVVAVVAVNLAIRWWVSTGPVALGLSFVMMALLAIAGWLGAELVHVVGVTHPATARAPAPAPADVPPAPLPPTARGDALSASARPVR